MELILNRIYKHNLVLHTKPSLSFYRNRVESDKIYIHMFLDLFYFHRGMELMKNHIYMCKSVIQTKSSLMIYCNIQEAHIFYIRKCLGLFDCHLYKELRLSHIYKHNRGHHTKSNLLFCRIFSNLVYNRQEHIHNYSDLDDSLLGKVSKRLNRIHICRFQGFDTSQIRIEQMGMYSYKTLC